MINKNNVITSRQNPSVKKVCSLCEKKWREEYGLFRFDGVKLFCEALDCGLDIEGVYIRESSVDSLCQRLSDRLGELSDNRIICVSDAVFEKLSDEKSPEGIITVAKYIDKFRKNIKIDNISLPPRGEAVLLLESLRDPGNLGTVIRSAAALGIDRVIISSDCADVYNSKTIRAAMGGLFRIRLDSVEAERFDEYIAMLRASGRRVFAAALDESAAILGELELGAEDCFVIGNEGHGLSERVISACDRSVIIPMTEGCESLNAASAAVILIWEMRRARA
ncbi:MAG: RNA methyltransferase [Clostridia bacterium]|nr:RNA methyltransferase [Clostridia bacterium]